VFGAMSNSEPLAIRSNDPSSGSRLPIPRIALCLISAASSQISVMRTLMNSMNRRPSTFYFTKTRTRL
jgi:hypothetical protein